MSLRIPYSCISEIYSVGTQPEIKTLARTLILASVTETETEQQNGDAVDSADISEPVPPLRKRIKSTPNNRVLHAFNTFLGGLMKSCLVDSEIVTPANVIPTSHSAQTEIAPTCQNCNLLTSPVLQTTSTQNTSQSDTLATAPPPPPPLSAQDTQKAVNPIISTSTVPTPSDSGSVYQMSNP